jgi:hypothetical protein
MTTTRKTPRRGNICKEGQDKEEGLASVKEVCTAAVQVDGGNAEFLLMAEVLVAIVTMSLLTVMLGAPSSLGVGTMMIIPGLLSPQQHPRQRQQRRVGSGVGGVPTMGTTSRHLSLTAATFSLGFHHFEFQVKHGELLWLYQAPT